MMIVCVKTWLFKLTKLSQVINKYTVVLNPVTYLVLVLLTYKISRNEKLIDIHFTEVIFMVLMSNGEMSVI